MLAETHATVGGADRGGAAVVSWRRRFEHGMALLHGLQEHLEDARAPLMRALEEVDEDPAAGPRERAMVLIQLGRLEGLQGRTAEAMAWLDKAQALVPDAPAIASTLMVLMASSVSLWSVSRSSS